MFNCLVQINVSASPAGVEEVEQTMLTKLIIMAIPSEETTGHRTSDVTEQGTPGMWQVPPQSNSQGGHTCHHKQQDDIVIAKRHC